MGCAPASTTENSDHHALPPVTVVICTKNRGAQISLAVESVLANNYPGFELLIFDQSTSEATRQALNDFAEDHRLRYVHSTTSGAGLARHLGLELAEHDIVLMTDDDCVVPVDWIARMAEAHVDHPRAAMVFCNVLPAPFDPHEGFIPITVVEQSVLIDSLQSWCRAGAANIALGAGMGMRRSLVRSLGGFDTHMGPGTPLRCAEETDLAVRALLHDYQVLRTTETSVIHHGFRSMREGRELMRGYMLGIAAAYTKLLRCGHWRLLPVMTFEIWRTVVQPIFHNLLRAQVPPVLGRALFLARGFRLAMGMPLDRANEVFRPSDMAMSQAASVRIALGNHTPISQADTPPA